MARIAFIGAGSFVFTRKLISDILTFPLLQDSTLVLMDVDAERLPYIEKAAKLIVKKGGYPAKVEATTDRKKALKGADAVICTILAGDVDVWRHDIEIPLKYGVSMNVGDTRSVAGIFRALRTVPVMLDICNDMQRLCPNATLLNYTNPMAMLCRAMQKVTPIQVTGLCHSVQGTAGMLARWLGAKQDEIDYVCAGINHQSWYIRFDRNGQDAIPALKKIVRANKEILNTEQVRNEMFLQLGYYVTESSGHNSEYNWWFRKRPDLIEKYCTHGTGWNPGEWGFILKKYQDRKANWREEIKDWLKNAAKGELDIRGGHEYASNIINALQGGAPFEFNGNMPNTGSITNLPPDVCVEVPTLANRRGLTPMVVGPLPPQCAALNNISIAVEEMAVDAALTGNAERVFHAVCYDPLSAAVCSLAEIRSMVKELLKVNEPYLPQFRSVRF